MEGEKKINKLFLTLLVVAGLAIIGAGWYFLIYLTTRQKEGDACKTTDGKDGLVQGGNCVPPRTVPIGSPPVATIGSPTSVTPIGFNSSKVNVGDIAIAQVPSLFFNNLNLTEGNISSFNLLTSAGSNPKSIHFDTSFNSQCSQYVWYKNWLYAYKGVVTDSNTGTKTCYYEIKNASLPNEIQVVTATGQCSNFKLYLSGVPYTYSSTKSVLINQATVKYCVYKK